MNISILGLLLLSALIHASWNLLAKRSVDKQAFLWLASLASLVAFVIPVVLAVRPVPSEAWPLILLSGVLEAIYFMLLGSAYQRGDMSLVYPLARGSAPLFVLMFASLLLGERVRWTGLVGIVLVVAGIYTLHLRVLNLRGLLGPFLSLKDRPSQIALLTGLTIGSYSVVDKVGVGYAGPIIYPFLVFIVCSLVLLPYMWLAKSQEIRREWRDNKASILAVGVMSLCSFLMVLFALTMTQVTYVSPVREISVMFGAVLGALVLREPFPRVKIAGSVLIFIGIVLISLVG
ncbi:MAG: EamA family transporter [Chloroflexota bacterium]|nr:EamA family transporter [Chloroflexota bacterium]